MWSFCFLRLLSSGSDTSGTTTSHAHVFTMLSLLTAGKQKLPARSALQWQDIRIKFHRNQSRVSHAKQANRQTWPPLVAFALRTSWDCLLSESKTWKVRITSRSYDGTRFIRLSARLLWQSTESSCSCLVQMNDHDLIMTETSRWDSFTTVLKDRVQFGSTAKTDFGGTFGYQSAPSCQDLIWLAFLSLRWGWECARTISDIIKAAISIIFGTKRLLGISFLAAMTLHIMCIFVNIATSKQAELLNCHLTTCSGFLTAFLFPFHHYLHNMV